MQINPEDIVITPSGSAPLIARMCDEINLTGIIDRLVTWDEKQCRTSPGTLIKGLVINILSCREPLYRVQEYFDELDMELLFGEGIQASAFNDDALGRALNKLAKADPQRVFDSIALSARLIHKVKLGGMHADTTSKMVYGEYKDSEPSEEKEGICITNGFSKDHRPDLKQFLYGLIVNNEGIPVFGQLMDGNYSDKTWNREALQKFNSIMPNGGKDCIYIADSALITKGNLDIILEQKIKFISRLPETFKIAAEIKQWACAENNWINLGPLKNKKDAAQYRAQSTIIELDGKEYRFIAYQSTNLDARKEKTIARKIEQERIALEKSCSKLAKQPFYCKADAEKAWEIFCNKNSGIQHGLTVKIYEEVTAKRKAGRPKAGSQPVTETTYRLDITIHAPGEAKITDLKAQASTFILMTNILKEKDLSVLNVLKEYKGQAAVECRFRFLKDPTYVDGIYLKNPERIEALGYVFLMALLIFALLERRVRMNLQAEQEKLRIPGKIKTDSPTAVMMLEMLSKLQIILIHIEGQIVRKLPRNLFDSQIKKLLRMAGFDETIYLKPKT